MASNELTIQEAAAALTVSTQTVRRWIKRGRLPAKLRPGPHGPQYFIPAGSVEGERAADPPPAAPVVEVETLANLLSDQLRGRLAEQIDTTLDRWGMQLLRKIQAMERQLAQLRSELVEFRRNIERQQRQ